jgi:hypothetical protein
MKLLSSRALRTAGFTFAEMAVSMGVLMLLGLIFFMVLNSGMVLFAKNTAVNTAHEEARQGINRLTRDIHAAVSVPQLRDANFNVVSSKPVSGVPPTAAGVSFQNVAAGPNYVWKDPGNESLIMIRDDKGSPATPGMRLIVPFYNLEADITKVAASGSANHRNIFIHSDEVVPPIDAPPVGGTYCITYYTDRVMYVVQGGQYVVDPQGPWILSGGNYVPYTSGTMTRYRFENGELRLYRQRRTGSTMFWSLDGVVARFISSPRPFFVPLNSGGTPNNKYVGVKLTAHDPKSSNRRYRATATLLETQIDYRSRIALYQ